jgi:hypothetical protein
MTMGRFLGLLVVLGVVLGVLMISPVGDMINARVLEAQAQYAQAQAQMLEVQNERLQLLPLTFAAMKDSVFIVVFVVFNQGMLMAVIVCLVKELKKERERHDNVSVSGLR